jgi:hypothetical protein
MSEKKFKYPLAIEGTVEQLELLVPKLEELGYVYDGAYRDKKDYLCTNVDNLPSKLSILGYDGVENKKSRTKVSASNPELVLALAACVDDDKPHAGEFVVRLDSMSWASLLNKNCPNDVFNPGDTAKITRVGVDDHTSEYVPLEINFNVGLYGMSSTAVRKATKEEIISHFTKQENNMAVDLNKPFGPRKIKGYKFKPGFEKFEKQAKEIAFTCPYTSGANFSEALPNSISIRRLKEAGVLDLWFEPVYEEEKTILPVVSQDGPFDVEINGGGIYFGIDKVNVNSLRNFISNIEKCRISVGSWNTSITRVSIGCKKEIPLEDIVNVLKAYDTLRATNNTQNPLTTDNNRQQTCCENGYVGDF